jgi:sortase (surface protein transpeptidase)
VATAPVKEITGPTPYEAITLITCGGSFNRSNLSYNQRLIVRATRTTTTASSP